MIELDSLRKRFSGVVAIDHVSLKLEAGGIVGLIGPNGSGKTTLLAMASGVIRPTEGRIRVGGVDLTGKGPTGFARRGVGRTFQQVRLFEGFTVAETVEVGAIAKGLATDEADEPIRILGLDEHRDREAATLAYGLQRRVEIARALAGRPEYLLLDEPAAGMNEGESRNLVDAIRSVVGSLGCGVLIVEHDLHLIMSLCQRVHVLSEGKTIAEGTPEQVRSDPAVIETYIGNSNLESHGRDE
jgi:ABC-type branched-subunit amino acid transport system ATPase component